MIEFDNVSYQVHERALLQDVTLTIPAGQWVAVVGRNGSGKTTLARHMNALLLPTSGTVRVNGMATSDAQHRYAIRGQVGLVFQHPDHQIVAALVEEDVAFGPENYGLAPAVVRERVQRALEATGLAALARHPTHSLSGGQKQRLAIAGLLALEPRCMVLDEPTSMLDPQGREEVLAALQHLHGTAGMGIILITHAMEEVLLAERVLVVEGGRVQHDGRPLDLFADPERLQALGLQPPPMVELANGLRKRGFPAPLEALTEQALFEWLAGFSIPRSG